MVSSFVVDFVHQLVAQATGCLSNPSEGYLVAARLQPLVHRYGADSLEALLRSLDSPGLKTADTIRHAIIDAMMPSDTSFFRDAHLFKHLKNLALPDPATQKPDTPPVAIWCAACATGQEAYSIAMTLASQGDAVPSSVTILATDVSEQALTKAQAGLYTQSEVQRGVPLKFLVRFFTQEGPHWALKPSLSKGVAFQRHNLLMPPPSKSAFDSVFCRNVLRYLSNDKKEIVLNHLHSALKPDGYLYLGADESPWGASAAFDPDDSVPGLYRPNRLKGTPTFMGGDPASVKP